MALTASWLCFAPRQFARGRDYEVRSTHPLSAQAGTAFTVLAEGLLRAGTATSEPVWQFAALTPEGPAVLARCDFEAREGARVRVIWALALPLSHVRASGLALHAMAEGFAELPSTAAEMPHEVPLKEQRSSRNSAELTTLLARYIEAGSVRVSMADSTQALQIFCQTLELLPPGDRVRVSFSTAASEGRTFEADPNAPGIEALAVGDEARAIANLWSIFRYGVNAPAQADLSLLRNPVDWICSMLATEDIAIKFRGLSKLVVERLESAQQATAFALLRRALELQLMRVERKRASETLVQLEADGYLGADYGTPPIWIARLAIELNLMAQLPPPLLQKVLRPGSLAFLLSSLQRAASVTRLQCWVASLQRPGKLEAEARRELLQACGAAWRDLLAPRRRFGHADLSRSVALLALYEHCRSGAPKTAPKIATSPKSAPKTAKTKGAR